MASTRRRAARRGAGLLALALGAAACEPSTEPRRVAAELEVTAGDLLTATVGTAIGEAVVVTVLDDRGRGLPGQVVEFSVVSGAGTLAASAVVTDELGMARNRWTLGTVAGDTQRVEARTAPAEAGAAVLRDTVRAVGTPGNAASLAAVGSTTRAGQPGQALADSLAVVARDAYGNPVGGVTVAFTGSGGFSPASRTTGADGIARSRWTLGGTAGAQQAQATAAGVGSVAFTATATAPAQPPGGTPGPVTHLVLSRASLNLNCCTPNTASGVEVTATAMDAQGRVVPDAVVTWSVTPDTIVRLASDFNPLRRTVHGTFPGQGLLTASSNGVSATISVRVNPTPAPRIQLYNSPNTAVDGGVILHYFPNPPIPPEELVLRIRNPGPGTVEGLSASVQYESGTPPFLQATLDRTTAPALLTLRVTTRTGLRSGANYAQVTVSSTTPGAAPVTFSIVVIQ
ncbi:MAG TPA: Ig-like domain-containing protein [Longimicrobium sp.]|nr:Ig-like domain-containing protein [Longimicrobium sp.]